MAIGAADIRYWTKQESIKYNETRPKTPVFRIGNHTLWVGGEEAATDEQGLVSNNIVTRLSCVGKHLGKKSKLIKT